MLGCTRGVTVQVDYPAACLAWGCYFSDAFLFFYGLIYVPLAEAIGLSFIAPLIALYLAAALFGWLVYAEKVTVTTVAGTALIVIGCLIAASQQTDHVDHVESTAV